MPLEPNSPNHARLGILLTRDTRNFTLRDFQVRKWQSGRMDINGQHLNSHHRDTVEHIFRHPLSHNVRWVDVVSLLNAVAETEERHDGRFKVSLGDEIHVFDPPRHKDVDTQMLMDIRRMLKSAGYGPQQGAGEESASE